MNNEFENALLDEQRLEAELRARLAKMHQHQLSTPADLRDFHLTLEKLKAARVARSQAAQREAARLGQV
jgi:hypothetical protein